MPFLDSPFCQSMADQAGILPQLPACMGLWGQLLGLKTACLIVFDRQVSRLQVKVMADHCEGHHIVVSQESHKLLEVRHTLLEGRVPCRGVGKNGLILWRLHLPFKQTALSLFCFCNLSLSAVILHQRLGTTASWQTPPQSPEHGDTLRLCW